MAVVTSRAAERRGGSGGCVRGGSYVEGEIAVVAAV